MPRPMLAPVALAACVLAPLPAEAQEFRIYTRVENEAQAGGDGRPEIVGRALSLFHAGKAYDYVDTTADGEVIIFEPTASRFTVLNTSRDLCTTVHFDELNHRLGLARDTAEEFLAELQGHPAPRPQEVIDGLRFGLDPKFTETWDAKRKVLTLAGSHLTYRATCAEAKSADVVETYLRYADWMARLNYALHPHAPYPAARLALNDSLRRKQVIPVEVRLETELSHPGRLRAEHQIQWQLDAKDRHLIHEWETMTADPRVRRVTFQEYQRLVLLGSGDQRQ